MPATKSNGLTFSRSIEVFPNAAALQEDDQRGRLEVSTIDGDPDGDGDFDQLFSYGACSFSIWDAFGNLVFDSGDQIEQIAAERFPGDISNRVTAYFSCEHKYHNI